jgi:rhamnose transport system substrate-binding protein
LLAKQIGDKGDIGIVSAAAPATNQNAWIGYMKQELTKYPNMHLVSIVYGNDGPTTATQVTHGLLQKYPHLAGIISPMTVGIAAAGSSASRRSLTPPEWPPPAGRPLSSAPNDQCHTQRAR